MVERHLTEKHRDKKSHLHIIRDGEQSMDLPSIAVVETQETETPSLSLKESLGKNVWRCGSCDFECATRAEVLVHTDTFHGTKSQFRCAICNYRSQSKFGFDGHFASKHPGMEIEVINTYYRVDGHMPDNTFDTSPLWRRDLQRVKHIRGILFDDDQLKNKTETIAVTEDLAPTGHLFECSICKKFSTKNKDELKHHLFKELKYFRFACKHCNKRTCDYGHMLKHMSRVHPTEQLQSSITNLPEDKESEEKVELVLATQQTLMQLDAPQISMNKVSRGKTTKGPSVEEVEQKTKPFEDDKKYQCPECPDKCRTQRGLKTHIVLNHLEGGRWRCNNCIITRSVQSQMAVHCRTVHPEVKENSYSLNTNHQAVCQTLTNTFWVNKYNMISEGKTLSPKKRPCPNESEEESKEDVDVIKDNIKGNKETQAAHPCPHCTYRAMSARDLKRHEMRHWVEKPYKCGYCDFSAIRIYDVKLHSTRLHVKMPVNVLSNNLPSTPNIQPVRTRGKRKYDANDEVIFKKCKPLDEAAILISDTDDSSDIYKCHYCEFDSDDRSAILDHWNKDHSTTGAFRFQYLEANERTEVYGCQLCEFTAKQLTDFDYHVKTNHDFVKTETCAGSSQEDVLTYKCPMCTFSTRQFVSICEHLRGHTKPYQCGYCAIRFLFRSKVVQHLALVHPDYNEYVLHLQNEEDEYLRLKSLVIEKKRGSNYMSDSSTPANSFPTHYRSPSNTARKSTTLFPRISSKEIFFARKSTGNSPKFQRFKVAQVEPYSYYGTKPVPCDLDKVTVKVSIDNLLTSLTMPVYSKIFKINPTLLLVDIMRSK